jgi:hypothetical protein
MAGRILCHPGSYSEVPEFKIMLGNRLPTVSIVQEAGWAPELVWSQRLEEKPFASPGDRTSIAWSSSQ